MLSKGNDEGIRFFEGTWSEALAAAKAQDKLIFLDAYAAWCGPCIRMARDVFPLKPVGDFYNTHFINLKIDMEKGEGVELAKQFRVRVYPTLLFLNGDGEVVHRAVGGRNGEGLIALGEEAMDDTRNFRSVELAYKNNPGDVNAMIDYAMALKETYDRTYAELITAYMEDKPMSLLLTATGWRILNTFVDDHESPEFIYLLENRNTFNQQYGDSLVTKLIDRVVEQMINRTIRKNDAEEMQQLMLDIERIGPGNTVYYLALANAQYGRRNGEWETYAQSIRTMITIGPVLQQPMLNRYAMDFYKNVEGEEELKWMIATVSASLKEQESYSLRHAHAALLFKAGFHREALKEANAAIVVAKQEDVPFEETVELITAIEDDMKKH